MTENTKKKTIKRTREENKYYFPSEINSNKKGKIISI